ncbi:MAG: hypothetical protein RLZ37_1589 [Actinomycetota bacterium]|jgi:hypothetical protein
MFIDIESGTDSGSTLVEAIVGISLLGLIVVGVVDASWTSTRVAAEVRHRSVTHVHLAEIDEVLRESEYSPCPHIDLGYVSDFDDMRILDEERPVVVVTNYEYWNRASSQWLSLASLAADQCSTTPDLTDRLALQRITMSILDSRGSSTSRTFLKAHDPQI